eukprot:scaffold4144_cov154-Skeletonema_dohrnii-CCMP3373.AAC.1
MSGIGKHIHIAAGRGMCFGGLNEPPWHTALPPNRPESGHSVTTIGHSSTAAAPKHHDAITVRNI